MKKKILRFLSRVLFLLTCSGPVADEAEQEGLIRRDYSD